MMARVGDVMTREVITFSPDDSIHGAARILHENRISGAPVVDGGKVVGILSEGDIMELLESKDLKVNTILPSPLDVLELPVRMRMGLKEVSEKIEKIASARVGDIMSHPPCTISKDAEISEAAAIMSEKGINRLPVVDEGGALLGILTRGDVIASF
jgi:CBS domain-containing protein